MQKCHHNWRPIAPRRVTEAGQIFRHVTYGKATHFIAEQFAREGGVFCRTLKHESGVLSKTVRKLSLEGCLTPCECVASLESDLVRYFRAHFANDSTRHHDPCTEFQRIRRELGAITARLEAEVGGEK